MTSENVPIVPTQYVIVDPHAIPTQYMHPYAATIPAHLVSPTNAQHPHSGPGRPYATMSTAAPVSVTASVSPSPSPTPSPPTTSSSSSSSRRTSRSSTKKKVVAGEDPADPIERASQFPISSEEEQDDDIEVIDEPKQKREYSKWTDQAEKVMIHIRKQNNDRWQKKDGVRVKFIREWDWLAEQVNKQCATMYTGKQVRDKWDALLRKWKAKKDAKKKTGSEPVKFNYEQDFDEIHNNKLYEPEVIASAGIDGVDVKEYDHEKSTKKSRTTSYEHTETSSSTHDTDDTTPAESKKRAKKSVKKITEQRIRKDTGIARQLVDMMREGMKTQKENEQAVRDEMKNTITQLTQAVKEARGGGVEMEKRLQKVEQGMDEIKGMFTALMQHMKQQQQPIRKRVRLEEEEEEKEQEKEEEEEEIPRTQ